MRRHPHVRMKKNFTCEKSRTHKRKENCSNSHAKLQPSSADRAKPAILSPDAQGSTNRDAQKAFLDTRQWRKRGKARKRRQRTRRVSRQPNNIMWRNKCSSVWPKITLTPSNFLQMTTSGHSARKIAQIRMQSYSRRARLCTCTHSQSRKAGNPVAGCARGHQHLGYVPMAKAR